MTPLYEFPHPVEKIYTLQHDTAGWTIQSHLGTHPSNGAACQVFDVPDGTPDGNGVTLTIPGQDPYHGVLYLHLPTGAGIVIDVFPAGSEPTTGPERGQLHTSGINLMDESNQPWCLRGYTVHLMPSLIYRGVDVTACMDEAKGYGANTLIPICTHLSPWKVQHGFYLNPLDDLTRWQGTLGVMFDEARDRGLRVAPAILADCQGLSVPDQQRIWHAACEVMKGRWNVLARIGNEWPVNGWYPGDFDLPDLGGVLASRGSSGENVPPFQAYWQFAEWQARRDPVYKAMDDAGAGVLELNHGYTASDGTKIGPFPCPIIQVEPAFFHDTPQDAYGDNRWTDPKLALALGLNSAANCAGIGFGASDGLECKPLGSIAAQCAKQMYVGAMAAFLR